MEAAPVMETTPVVVTAASAAAPVAFVPAPMKEPAQMPVAVVESELELEPDPVPAPLRVRPPLEDPAPWRRGVREVVFADEDRKEPAHWLPPAAVTHAMVPHVARPSVEWGECRRQTVGIAAFARAQRPQPPRNLPPEVAMTAAECEDHIDDMSRECRVGLGKQDIKHYRTARVEYESKKALFQQELALLDVDATVAREMEDVFIYVEKIRGLVRSKPCKRAAAAVSCAEEAKRMRG